MKLLLTKVALLDHSVSHYSCHVTPPPPPQKKKKNVPAAMAIPYGFVKRRHCVSVQHSVMFASFWIRFIQNDVTIFSLLI